jgi:hypothetical protein
MQRHLLQRREGFLHLLLRHVAGQTFQLLAVAHQNVRGQPEDA